MGNQIGEGVVLNVAQYVDGAFKQDRLAALNYCDQPDE